MRHVVYLKGWLSPRMDNGDEDKNDLWHVELFCGNEEDVYLHVPSFLHGKEAQDYCKLCPMDDIDLFPKRVHATHDTCGHFC